MNLQRGNALCVMGTVAHHKKLKRKFNTDNVLNSFRLKTNKLIHTFFYCLQKRKAQDEEVEKIQNERKTQNRTLDRFLP